MDISHQVIENHLRQTTIGLSLDFEVLNAVGFCCFSIYAYMFLYDGTLRSEYQDRNGGVAPDKVSLQDLLFGLHAVVLTVITILQVVYYDGRKQRMSRGIVLILSAMVGSIIIYLIVVAANYDDDGNHHSGRQWLDWVYFLSYIKMSISLMKGIPQAYLNFKRKSTVGWNIHNILLDFTGGSLRLVQLLLDCQYTGTWGDVTGDGRLSFGLSLISMSFDVLFLLQHFVFYRRREEAFDFYALKMEESDKKELEGFEGDII